MTMLLEMEPRQARPEAEVVEEVAQLICDRYEARLGPRAQKRRAGG